MIRFRYAEALSNHMGNHPQNRNDTGDFVGSTLTHYFNVATDVQCTPNRFHYDIVGIVDDSKRSLVRNEFIAGSMNEGSDRYEKTAALRV